MNFTLKPLAIAINLIVLSSCALALPVLAFNSSANMAQGTIKDIEVITISNQRHNTLDDNQSYAQGKTTEADLANWLASVPGANINSNGPITGIAQYRGLFGDRVATSLDGHPIVGAGPNAMDTPLSYSTPLIVDSMTVYRGIAPVSAGMNTLGGAIDIKMRKAEVIGSDTTQVSGDLQAGYRSNNSASTLSGVTNIAKGDVAVLLYGNTQAGDDMESGDGTVIAPTEFDKTQAGFDIRHSVESNTIGLSYHYTKTTGSGTPALPMDIEYIESQRINVDGDFLMGEWQGEWSLGYLDADHGMTNFLMRAHDPMKKRRNTAIADTTDFKFVLNRELSFGDFSLGEIAFGIDGYMATHDSVITNPSNDMFEVVNFNNVTDDRVAFFTEWQNTYRQTTIQLGVRVKHAKSNADEVHGNMPMNMTMGDMNSGMGDMPAMDSGMAMPSMGTLMSDLEDDFNNADREVSDTNVDVALSTETQLSESLSLYIGAGVKNRAPSYQERYLWTPMEATGGLADGHTYIGDINLESETAYQGDLGLTWQSSDFMIAPHVFYQNIDNYIQGTPMGMDDMAASSMASMMSGDDNALKFSNVDAKLYGADVNWYYNINDSFQLSGIASYVKGERRDIDDNLYRIAPLNGQVSFTYHSDNIIGNVTLIAVAAQNDVSETNTEQATAGYGLVNIDVEYFVSNDFTLRGGVDNLLDREYQNHLGGYNRVKEMGTPVMTRLPSEGMSAWIEATYSF
ncbi:TonB-dependent receptor [Colwellia sp. 75C3]|uniref:TonB-dependent receptor n=1 Tax=Colwellia sp. 75C3 TaxID=888425 RepID=UPI000C34C26D|nr:TonB-dependent receptor [Colwellia sp. 75C3]PKG83158.1 TonB-dependent receptor [Colwellia sp. 75C3]